MKKVNKWVTVEDKDIRHIWRCDNECSKSEESVVTPDWYQNNGTPMCFYCDSDMVYDHTEVRMHNG